MKVLAINGSPKGIDSCTNRMLQPLLEGMKGAGAKTEVVHLADKNIHHCVGCLSCWIKTPGQCIFNDSMAEILDKVIEADLIIFGTPLYVFTVTGLMKNFMDRMIPLILPFMEKNENGITMHPPRYSKGKIKMLLVSPCGFPELCHFDSLVSTFKRIAMMGGDEYLGEILRPTAELLRQGDQKKLESYYNLLRKAGKQIIEKNEIDKKTHNALHQLWILPEDFCKRANEYFQEKMIKSVGT